MYITLFNRYVDYFHYLLFGLKSCHFIMWFNVYFREISITSVQNFYEVSCVLNCVQKSAWYWSYCILLYSINHFLYISLYVILKYFLSLLLLNVTISLLMILCIRNILALNLPVIQCSWLKTYGLIRLNPRWNMLMFFLLKLGMTFLTFVPCFFVLRIESHSYFGFHYGSTKGHA